jgi:hypothetical protein
MKYDEVFSTSSLAGIPDGAKRYNKAMTEEYFFHGRTY